MLNEDDAIDLKMSLGTALTLQGYQLDKATEIFKNAADEANSNMMKGYIYNNLGIAHFFNFIEKSTQITSQKKPGDQGNLEIIGAILKHFEDAVHDLKLSVNYFENFKDKFAELDPNAGPSLKSKKTSEDVTIKLVK